MSAVAMPRLRCVLKTERDVMWPVERQQNSEFHILHLQIDTTKPPLPSTYHAWVAFRLLPSWPRRSQRSFHQSLLPRTEAVANSRGDKSSTSSVEKRGEKMNKMLANRFYSILLHHHEASGSVVAACLVVSLVAESEDPQSNGPNNIVRRT